jgi:AcrR family transcriptional regulator
LSDGSNNRDGLLAAATDEFATHGFAGARIERIVRRAHTTARMVYHYFGNKRGLYIAVLEQAMGELRRAELRIDVDRHAPLPALLELFDFTHSHFEAHPKLVSLLSAENLAHARYLRQSDLITEMSSPVLDKITALVERGRREGSLREDLDPLRLYVLMVSLCYFHLSNVHTLSAIFDRDLKDPAWRAARHADARAMLQSYLQKTAT